MQLADVEVGSPGPGQVKIRHTAIGLNFIDIYTRSGLYQTPLPNAVGREAAGVIVEVGPKTKGFKKGDRVAYCGVLGAYCQERIMGTEQLVHVPKGVSDEEAAAIMLKGMTTEYLVDHTPKGWLKKGDIILFHAAAGGVGLLFGQWAKARGYKVIGTVSSPEKAALAKKNGYNVVYEFCGHGVGLKFHEDPEVNHIADHNSGAKMKTGMIFTIEPMINLGTKNVILDQLDGWTARTADGLLSAQFEHTVLVTDDGFEILTLPSI